MGVGWGGTEDKGHLLISFCVVTPLDILFAFEVMALLKKENRSRIMIFQRLVIFYI